MYGVVRPLHSRIEEEAFYRYSISGDNINITSLALSGGHINSSNSHADTQLSMSGTSTGGVIYDERENVFYTYSVSDNNITLAQLRTIGELASSRDTAVMGNTSMGVFIGGRESSIDSTVRAYVYTVTGDTITVLRDSTTAVQSSLRHGVVDGYGDATGGVILNSEGELLRYGITNRTLPSLPSMNKITGREVNSPRGIDLFGIAVHESNAPIVYLIREDTNSFSTRTLGDANVLISNFADFDYNTSDSRFDLLTKNGTLYKYSTNLISTTPIAKPLASDEEAVGFTTNDGKKYILVKKGDTKPYQMYIIVHDDPQFKLLLGQWNDEVVGMNIHEGYIYVFLSNGKVNVYSIIEDSVFEFRFVARVILPGTSSIKLGAYSDDLFYVSGVGNNLIAYDGKDYW